MGASTCSIHGVRLKVDRVCCESGFFFEKPTEADLERAKQIAREQGWLTDDGWIWELEESETT
jgi:hypothetical protein